MKKPLIFLYILGLSVLTATAGLAAPTAADHVRAGDIAFAKFDDVKALAEYEQAVRLDPANSDALTGAALASLNVGDRLPKGTKEAEAAGQLHFQAGRQYILKALALRPNDSRAHFLYAAVLGRQVSTLGRKDQIAAANEIKAEIDRAITLDPANDQAWHALAFWNRTLAEMSGSVRLLGGLFFGKVPKGSLEEAVKDFQKAIALNPAYCGHHIELAQAWLDLKKKEMAASELLTALNCPDLTSQCARFKQEARLTLDKLIASGGVSGTLVAVYVQQNLAR